MSLRKDIFCQQNKNHGCGRGWIVLIVFFIVLVFLNIFLRLDQFGISDDDEAWHANNAYEMYQTGHELINTYNYQVDYYNSKPPLNLWCIIAAFHLFGVSLFSLKLPSAIAGFLTCVIWTIFVCRHWNARAGAFCAGAFLLLQYCYDFHCFRAGNMDALFCLLCSVCFIALYESCDRIIWVVLFWLSFGLAFLAKGPHAFILLLLWVLSFVYRKQKTAGWRTVAASVLAAIVPTGYWAIRRFLFDGTEFFKAMLIGEVEGKTSNLFTNEYLVFIMHSGAYIILLITALIYAVGWIIRIARSGKMTGRREFTGIWRRRPAFLIIWIVIPVVFYSVCGTFHEWYVYPSFVAVPALIGVLLNGILNNGCWRSAAWTRAGNAGLTFFCLLLFAITGIRHIDSYYRDNGGNPSEMFQGDLEDLNNSEEGKNWDGATAYIQDTYISAPGERTNWKEDEMALARYVCHYDCQNGGIQGFLDDDHAVLVLNKDLWDEYADVLTGHVILEDDYKLILCSSRYGE